MKTIIFTNARDEAHIVEWIAHHLNLGFTTVYITDHKSIVPIKTLVKEDSRIFISRLDADIAYMKWELMNQAIKYAKKENYDWMIYLDADEFIYLKDHENISDFLNTFKDYDLIGLSWLMFGSNYLEKDDTTKTILELYTKCHHCFDQHIKSFVRPQKATSPENPHYYKGINHTNAISATRKSLQKPSPWWTRETSKYTDVSAYIAHYVYQSYDVYLSRKIDKPMDDTGKFRKNNFTIESFHKQHNDIKNTDLFDKYNERNIALIKELQSTVTL